MTWTQAARKTLDRRVRQAHQAVEKRTGLIFGTYEVDSPAFDLTIATLGWMEYGTAGVYRRVGLAATVLDRGVYFAYVGRSA